MDVIVWFHLSLMNKLLRKNIYTTYKGPVKPIHLWLDFTLIHRILGLRTYQGLILIVVLFNRTLNLLLLRCRRNYSLPPTPVYVSTYLCFVNLCRSNGNNMSLNVDQVKGVTSDSSVFGSWPTLVLTPWYLHR